jgi:hypothetical protein
MASAYNGAHTTMLHDTAARSVSNATRLDGLEPRVDRIEGFIIKVVVAGISAAFAGGGLATLVFG